ncbi:NfeD family protein [Luteipulveratus sp. YIM 133132]|uniref:NfeD family protein n=1 Tax=Luteipulveratus flavus TaxID=3031728 RepID=UPI0023AFFE94|nr:NfeD family protein [Luteipulveratus sp. YIM 133132]MDE9364620.1 NfeD family protein [Luteipulveratus sp. YIM 133132]
MSALLWFIAALVLAAAELLGAEFVLLMVAGGALGGAATAALLPDNHWLPFVVFAVITVLLVVVVRPPLLRHLNRQEPPQLGVRRIIGAPATVLAPVDEHRGEVKVHGEVWSARTYASEPTLDAGAEVTVTEVRGATVYVRGESHG